MSSAATDIARGMKADDPSVQKRFEAALHALHCVTDRFFAKLMVMQWMAAIVVAYTLSPLTWGERSSLSHPHVYTAVIFGAAITLVPFWFGIRNAGAKLTRYTLAVAQILMSALFIHLMGGRIETHFHLFGSLAFLAFYRDIRVLWTATVIVAADHLIRGIFWPESVYGVFEASPLRTFEHAFWVLFEVGFLSISIQRSHAEMREVARRQTTLEGLNEDMAGQVEASTIQLQASEERFRALYNDAPLGLFQATPRGEIIVANTALLKILDFSSIDAMREVDFRLCGASTGHELTALLASFETSDLVAARDVVWRRRDGSEVHVHETIKALRNAKGDIEFIEGSIEDITERRELQDRYHQAQKVQAIGQLAGGVAHDFNNILTAIIGYTDLLLEKGNLESAPKAQVEEIRRAGERAASLTQQLLAFSRKQTLLPRVMQMNSVVAEMEKMLTRLVGEHIQVRKVLASDLATVKIDPGQIQQVIMNLVVNARDAMTNGGKLTIETTNTRLDAEYCRLHPDTSPGEYVVLAVSDTGTGMSQETRNRLFEPFFTTKGVGAGTGLGLATCHGIVKQSGGWISVYSELGTGSTFRVYLPACHEKVEERTMRDRPMDQSRGTETVLLVEDEPMVRELGVLALSSLGYRVIEASNGVEAINRLEKVGTAEIELIVTDVVMPEMGGRELASRARALDPTLRVLFSSGYTYDAIEQSQLLEERTYFLAKPYTMGMLANKIREVLDNPVRDEPPTSAN
jgi:PAS domain S-box-containing protein